MMRSKLRRVLTLLAIFLVLAPAFVSASPSDADLTNTELRVLKALKRLPYYGVFDHIDFEVEGNVVTLTGKVRQATLRGDAEAAVRRLEEVARVENKIEILPVSSHDDRLRLAAARAVFANAFLTRYAAGPVPAIHIIVERGKIILEGVVRNQTHRNVAELAARGVSGAFAVENNLRWEIS